jgi:hypothetical protein
MIMANRPGESLHSVRKMSFVIMSGLTALLIGHSLSTPPSRFFTTLMYTHVAGLQGWFACPSDPIKVGWGHWFRGGSDIKNPDSLAIDVWPDTSELEPDEKCPTPFKLRSGEPAYLFSDQNPKTVDRQFRWMQQYGLDGAAVQRFVSHLDGKSLQGHFDTVLRNVRLAAEAHRRGFFIVYDGIEGDAGVEAIKTDWRRLTEEEHIVESPAYMFHRGKPVVGLWGIGFTVRKLTPKQAEDLISFFRTTKVAATVLGGVPGHWRTLNGASRPEQEWASVYRSLNVISPWTVGGFSDNQEANNFAKQYLIPDLAETRKLRIDYMPVIWPSFSWHNGAGRARNSPLNQIPRKCGYFYRNQVDNILKAGADMIYTAMFDEANEGTSIFKMAPHSNSLPDGVGMIPLDADGCSIATGDMYLQLAGEATRRLNANR